MDANGKLTVLYVHSGTELAGDTLSLWNLIESVRDRVNPIVLLVDKGLAYDLFTKNGVPCIVRSFQTALSLPIKDQIKTNKILTHPWRIRAIKWFRYDLSCVRYVEKELSGQIVDIVHVNAAFITIGLLLRRRLKAKLVWHIREYIDSSHIPYNIYGGRKCLRRKINRADARIVSSNRCRDFWKLTLHNTWTVWDAVAREENCFGNTEKQPYLLFCSYNVIEAKGATFAVRAYGMSGLASEGMRLKIVGGVSSEYKSYILATAEQYAVKDAVDFLPVQNDVKPLFAEAKAYINPSVNEGMGRTTAEAMFYGCPVVALASGGTLDLIKRAETGWLFNTEEECAELMKKVCHTNQEQIVLQAQEFAKKNLSIENYGKQILSVYKAVGNV